MTRREAFMSLPRPPGDEPIVWSWAAQQIACDALYAAKCHLLQERFGHVTGWARLVADNEIERLVREDPDFQRRFFEVALREVGESEPSDGWEDGPETDRQHAAILTWYKVLAASVCALEEKP